MEVKDVCQELRDFDDNDAEACFNEKLIPDERVIS
jgi:hypothetical protein